MDSELMAAQMDRQLAAKSPLAVYVSLDSGDLDISSSGPVLLDPGTFSGGGVNRVAVVGGKGGVIYVMDADDLGGFKMGK